MGGKNKDCFEENSYLSGISEFVTLQNMANQGHSKEKTLNCIYFDDFNIPVLKRLN